MKLFQQGVVVVIAVLWTGLNHLSSIGDTFTAPRRVGRLCLAADFVLPSGLAIYPPCNFSSLRNPLPPHNTLAAITRFPHFLKLGTFKLPTPSLCLEQKIITVVQSSSHIRCVRVRACVHTKSYLTSALYIGVLINLNEHCSEYLNAFFNTFIYSSFQTTKLQFVSTSIIFVVFGAINQLIKILSNRRLDTLI